MPRQWGATRAYVRELDQVPSGVNFSYGGQQYLTNVVPNSATWNRLLSQIGQGGARFYATQNWEQFLVPGRVLVVEQPVSGYPGFLVRTITCFLIEDVEPSTIGEIEVRGPGVETLLTRKPRFEPIGEERVYATAVAPQNQLPVRTTLAQGVPPGNTSAALTNATGIEIGEGLRIRRGDNNDGDWHVATVTGKSGNTLNFSPAMSGQAAAGNSVQGWPSSGGDAAHAPIVTTLVQGAPHGMDAATLATTDGIIVGDEVRIRTGAGNAGPWWSGRVRTVNPAGAPYPDTIQFDPDLTADAPVGNSVEIRAGWLRVYDPSGYAEGQRVTVAMNGGGLLETVVSDVDGDGLAITIREGLTAAASIGNAVTAYDYGARTTADVTQAMQTAPDWQVTFQTGNGSAEGTAFAPKGESVFDILMSIADRTGEFFRYSLDASGIPTRRLEWRRSPDWSGVTLILYDTDEYARQRADELDATKGAAFSIRKRISQPLITRIYPSAGDQAITLASCSEEALLYAAVEGCSVHISDDFYEPDYIELAAGVANPKIGVQAIRQTYGDISIADATNTEQLVAACDQLLLSAVQELLQAQLREYYTVEAYVPVALKPGQAIKIENATRVEPAISTATSYIILEVQERQVGGRSRTTLTVSNMLGLRRSGANTLGGILRSTVQSLRRVSGGGGGGGSISVTGSVVGSHVHAEYLPVAGGVTLAGNMPVAPGVTIDDVDISGHAANPDAHHARVTVTNNGLLLAGQALGLRLSSAAPGLQISSTAGQEGARLLLQSPSGLEVTAAGLALADATAGEGLKLVGKVMHLDLASPSGMLIAADRLALAMADSDISATSYSELRPTGHRHRIINTNDGQTNPNTVLSAGAYGQLRLGGLSIGAAWAGTDVLFAQAVNATQTVARLKAAAAQTAPLWRVENSAGQALILLTPQGDLESGNPGFVSRVAGWQLTQSGNAELNNAFIRGELHAATFVADEMHATGGTMAVMTAAKVSKAINAGDNVLPAVGSTFTLNMQASWDSGLSYFAANDVVRIKPMGEVASGGSLDLYDMYLQVVAVGSLTGRNLANGNAGYYPMTVRRLNGGATGVEIPISAAVRWAKIGGVGYTGGMILSSDLPQSPYLDIFTIDATQGAAAWQSAPVTPVARVRVGNLDGVLGLPEQWGMAAGTNLSDTSTAARYLVASNLQFRLNNVDLSVYRGAAEVVRLNSGADGSDPSIALGHPNVPTGLTSGGAGFYAAHAVATGKALLRIGGATGPALRWDGSGLSWYDATGTATIVAGSTGNVQIAGVVTLGAPGGIWQGTGTFESPTTGLKLYNQGGIGRLATFNGGLIQTALDTDGAFKAGWDGSAWNVVMNRDGLALTAGLISTDVDFVATPAKRVTWMYGGAAAAWISGRYVSSTGASGLEIVAGPSVAAAGAQFHYKSGTPVASYVRATGDLRLFSGAGSVVGVFGGNLFVDRAVNADEYVAAGTSLYAQNGVVVGGLPLGSNENTPGVVTIYRRSQPPNPNPGAVALYIYHNTGTGKQELIMRNAAGATVKVAEIAAA